MRDAAVDIMAPSVLRSTTASLQPCGVRFSQPGIMSATDAERQRRSISQPRVARASGLPWDRIPHSRSTLKGLHLFASSHAQRTDATLSGLAGLGRALTQGRRWRANPGLIDGIPLGFATERPATLGRFANTGGCSWPCTPRAPSAALAQIRIR